MDCITTTPGGLRLTPLELLSAPVGFLKTSSCSALGTWQAASCARLPFTWGTEVILLFIWVLPGWACCGICGYLWPWPWNGAQTLCSSLVLPCPSSKETMPEQLVADFSNAEISRPGRTGLTLNSSWNRNMTTEAQINDSAWTYHILQQVLALPYSKFFERLSRGVKVHSMVSKTPVLLLLGKALKACW